MNQLHNFIRRLRAFFLPICLIAAVVYLAPGVLRTAAFTETLEGTLPSWASLFPFDAPAWSAAVLKAGTQESAQAVARVTRPADEVILLDDWTYTAIFRGRPTPSKFR
jgi:hypothetical protein